MLLVISALLWPAALRAGLETCPGEGLHPTKVSLPRVERAVLCLLNAERRGAGRVSLQRDARLNRSARFHSRDMVGAHFFAHERPGRISLFGRVLLSRYLDHVPYVIYGENLGFGPAPSDTAADMVATWMKSERHRGLVLNPSMRDVGIGAALAGPDLAFDPQRPSAVYTADFGRRYRHAAGHCSRSAAPRPAVRDYCRRQRS